MKKTSNCPYLFEERGKYIGMSKLLLKPRSTKEVSNILSIMQQKYNIYSASRRKNRFVWRNYTKSRKK